MKNVPLPLLDPAAGGAADALPDPTTAISWCDHTANAWWGCTKVHTGCLNCYSEGLSRRTGHDVWGPGKPRRVIGDVWGKLKRWNEEWAGKPRRGVVFCSSMCDVFEDALDSELIDHEGFAVRVPSYGPHHGVAALRQRLLEGIRHRPNLVHLLLTKRPDNVMRMVPEDWLVVDIRRPVVNCSGWPKNVMVGTSVSDQKTADSYVWRLVDLPLPNVFLSVEPMVDRVSLRSPQLSGCLESIDWVIIGCESMGNRVGRLPKLGVLAWQQYAGELVEECRAEGVPVFVKQIPRAGVGGEPAVVLEKDVGRFPEHLAVRERPGMLVGRNA